MTRTPTSTDPADADLAAGPLSGLTLHECLALATRLESRLVEHMVQPGRTR